MLAQFVAAEIPVSIPWGDNDRYDLVAENHEGRLLKIQVKTARLADEDAKLLVPLTSLNYQEEGGRRRNYRGEVDLIAAYSPSLDKIYLVKPDEGQQEIVLRLKPTKNNQKKMIRWAGNYEFKGTLPG